MGSGEMVTTAGHSEEREGGDTQNETGSVFATTTRKCESKIHKHTHAHIICMGGINKL